MKNILPLMKTMTLVTMAVLSISFSKAADFSNEKEYIESVFDTINVCAQGTLESCKRGENSCFFEIRDCRNVEKNSNSEGQNVTCEVEQTLPSSICIMDITIDSLELRPVSSVITADGRES